MFSIHQSIRDWPQGRGTACFRKMIVSREIGKKCESIMKSIHELGYAGLIDIELFYKEGKIYLNEINWRNSGGLYHNTSNNYNFPYIWYCDITGLPCISDDRNAWDLAPDYSMTEYSDIRYPLYRHYGWKKWLSDLKKTKSFSYFCRWDMRPALVLYMKVLKRIVTGKYKD